MKKQALSHSHAYDGESEIKLLEKQDRQLLFTPNIMSLIRGPGVERGSIVRLLLHVKHGTPNAWNPSRLILLHHVSASPNKETIQAPYKYSTIPAFHILLQQMKRSRAQIRGAY
jgi:hypothetical protein